MQIPGYKIERLIAEGGMSSVFLAVQESLGRRVALKVLKRFDSPQHAERFLHEARIIASLQHRNTITIHDVGTVGDFHYIAMEYLEGGSLADRIEQGMQPAEALDLLYGIAGCLDFVHRRDIVHRDIKPGNILFHSDGTPKLSDFGIAKQLDDDQELTMDGSAFGSPYYLSPEQAECRALDGRSDIYSLGIVFYQMLTGRRPYSENSQIETIVAHLSQPIPLLPEAMSGYQGLLERMIAKCPEDRVGSARDLLELIRQTGLPGPGQAATSAGGRISGTRGGQRNGIFEHLRRTSVLTAALVLSSALAFFLMPTDPSDDREPMAARDPAPAEPAVDDPRTSAFEQQVAVAAPKMQAPVSKSDPGPAADVTRSDPDTEASAAANPVIAPMDAVFDQVEPESPALVQETAAVVEVESTDGTRGMIDEWMSAGDRAFQADRLTTPANDNAYAHYLKVVEHDPGHQGAHAGIDRIADRYAELAGGALRNKDYRLAGLYVRRGSMVRPDDVDLALIRKELDAANQLAANAGSDEVAETAGPARAESGARSSDFGGISVRARGPDGTGNIAKDFMNVWRSVFD